uniref:Uncharacterized protein n=1 Tax=Arundo donax TaxID=35708 RepID=A0A0A9I205_ARUDO
MYMIRIYSGCMLNIQAQSYYNTFHNLKIQCSLTRSFMEQKHKNFREKLFTVVITTWYIKETADLPESIHSYCPARRHFLCYSPLLSSLETCLVFCANS